MKPTEPFISRNKQVHVKTSTVSESTFEIKICHLGHSSKFNLRQHLFANIGFCTKTRLCNIFKTTNTKTLIKAILESFYTILQTPWKATTLKQPIQFSWAVQFLATFYVWIIITFALLWQNQSNYNFQKLHFSLSKQVKIHVPTATQSEVTALSKLLKVTFFAMPFFEKRNIFLLVKIMGKDFSCTKIWSTTDHSSHNYGPSNLVFRFTITYVCHPN